ncbi:DUF2589 domain-containing protein [Cyclobacterium jeungdonense]|uniref:DUF2589 domain-containing protein n=1 Tax=Cyclobacterium jeungdonense TaxID=708087 RepID=A0ABT8C3E2_9BACT|nr:DUF2589 domain-containing protein [Cyclobacterium jeungdonense]MDN3686602.1 DUF2589 domain-containing protein [Cyclobacterium jeungdonense]
MLHGQADVELVQATADFINTVGFTQAPVDKKRGEFATGAARMLDFEFERPGIYVPEVTDKNPTSVPQRTIEEVKIRVPMLAVVPIPNLQVNTVDITFDMEVKSSTTETSPTDMNASADVPAKIGSGPESATVKIHGSVATHKESTRTSANSAKYHVEVTASNHRTPEGLARMQDIMATAATPDEVNVAPLAASKDRDAKTGKIIDASKKQVNPDGSHASLI